MPCLPNAYTHLLSSPYKELVVWLLVTSSHWRGQAELHQVFRIIEFQALRLLLKTNTFFYSKASPLLRRKYNCHALCSYDCPSSCTILLIIWGLWVQINWEENLMTEREIISCKWYLLLELWKGPCFFSLPSQLMAEKPLHGWHPQWQTTTAKPSPSYLLFLLSLTVTMLRDSVLPSPFYRWRM